MVTQTSRRRMIALCGGGAFAGLAGCLGDNGESANSEDDDATDGSGTDSIGQTDDNSFGGGGDDTTGEDGTSGSDSDDDGTDQTGGETVTNGDGITIRHNTKTGRYVFEGTSPRRRENDDEPDRFIWDVQSLDGYNATVEATFIEFGLGDGETMTLTASPDAPEPTLTEPYLIGDGYDISDLLSTRMVELWFPNYLLGDLDLGRLDVGADIDSQPNVSFEITGTDSHAGIDCYVVERYIGDEEYDGNYCLSPEHAMVISGEWYEDYLDEVRYEFELVEYEP